MGFDNFTSVVHDPVFVQALITTLFYVAGSRVLVTLVALLLALAVSKRVPGSRAYMSGMFLSNVMPMIAVCLEWRLLLHPHGSFFGIVLCSRR